MNKQVRLALALVAVAFASGCAVTDYKESVTALDGAMTETVTTMQALDKEVTDTRNKRALAALESSWKGGERVLLDPTEASCAAGLTGCVLTLERRDGKTQPYPATTSIPVALEALELTRAYTTALKEIVEADTVSKVTAGANAAVGSLENAVKSLAKNNAKSLAPAKFAAYKEPALALINWVVTRYVERVKVNALTDVTQQAQPVLSDLRDWYLTTAEAASASVLADALKAFNTAQETYDESPSSKSLTAYVKASADLDAALKAKTKDPLGKFLEAHEQLTKQLNGSSEVSLAAALAAVERFAAEAKALKGIIDGIRAARAK